MKKFLALCCCLFLWLPSLAQAFPNEPEGFRGLKWGAPFPAETNLRDKEWDWLQPNRAGHGAWYRRTDPRRFQWTTRTPETLGTIPVHNIYYLFVKDKFVKVQLDLSPQTVPEEILKELTLLWGEPSEVQDEKKEREYTWKGQQSHITLSLSLTEDKNLSAENAFLLIYETDYSVNTPAYKDLTDEQKKIIALQNDL